ncbi:transcription elongation factor GreB [Methylophilus medardicus]|uniref:Transcription elongation factor GreB n=1 Tax=Methylophilus medardicus TaxID=2588534 RepID=A0A5B8CT42_9PROT|nr:transcription elongation factor GreB [Methylophilus medardicus]QDC44457.1 transcription elongation factor GreB [Methylophilus medardicus]QDC49464.1 transcription elongation factor GreB [Methylophilus medardicus]QDC53169.1 transcription elongation factor GreB [Methylophilus medardicus]
MADLKNYITPEGYAALEKEFQFLIKVDRPEVVRVVSWAAGNGDRSENGDYIYGKKRLRQIDSRIRFLTKRMDAAEIVYSNTQTNTEQVFFGAWVTLFNLSDDTEMTVRIVGQDELDPSQGFISWVSPMAKALLSKRLGDAVRVMTPSAETEYEIIDIRYI